MHAYTIPVLGAVAFALAVPATADARPRFGPASVLGAFAAPLGALLGARPSFGHPRWGTTTARSRSGEPARAPNVARVDDLARTSETERAAPAAGMRSSWVGPVFWPHASDDMFEYAFLPNGAGERFWAYGHRDLHGVFADLGSFRGAKAVAAAADTKEPPTDMCGSVAATSSADGVIAHIEQAVQPSAAQHEMLGQLRTALTQASDRVKAACRATIPATPLERLDTMQDRIWAMRDAVLTVRMPLEHFYNSLNEEQKARLNGGDTDQRRIAGQGNYARERAVAQTCREQTTALSDTRAIESALRPSAEQRASFAELQMRLAGLTQLIMSSCPTQTPDGPLGKLAVAQDRLTTMLFALMTIGPALQTFYDSLSDTQKAEFNKVIRQQLRADLRT